MLKRLRTSTRTSFPSLALLLLAWGGASTAGAALPPRIEWVDCWFGPVWDEALRCAHF